MVHQAPRSITSIGNLKVAEVMRPGVIVCPPSADVPTLAATMVTHGIHAVFVASPAETLLIVSDLKVVEAARVHGYQVRASQLAKEPAATLSTEASVEDAVEMMAVRSIGHVVAVEPGSDTPAGVISSLDLAAVISGVEPRLARMLRPAPARPSSSARRLSDARVLEVMHPGVTACPADAPLWTVAAVMAEYRVHCVAVAGIASGLSPHLIWGLVEDTDFISALHRQSLADPAATVAESAPIAVSETEPLDRAAALMTDCGIRHVVVAGGEGIPSGIVSTLDVAGVLAAPTW